MILNHHYVHVQPLIHVETLMDLLMNSISTGEIQHIAPSEEVHVHPKNISQMEKPEYDPTAYSTRFLKS